MGSTTPACEPKERSSFVLGSCSLISCKTDWISQEILFSSDEVWISGQCVPLCITDCFANAESCGDVRGGRGSRSLQPYNLGRKQAALGASLRPWHRIKFQIQHNFILALWGGELPPLPHRIGFGLQPQLVVSVLSTLVLASCLLSRLSPLFPFNFR